MTQKAKFIYKGGPGSGHFGHSGRPGKVGGSSGGGGGVGSGGARSIPLGGSRKPHPTGYSVKFYGVPGYHKAYGDSDDDMDKLLNDIEDAIGRTLPRDSRTGYPNFSLYLDGEEIGGG